MKRKRKKKKKGEDKPKESKYCAMKTVNSPPEYNERTKRQGQVGNSTF